MKVIKHFLPSILFGSILLFSTGRTAGQELSQGQTERHRQVPSNTKTYPSEQGASATPFVAVPSAPANKEKKRDTVTSAGQQTLRVVLPEISIHKDRIDYAYIGFNFLLVLVGAMQVVLLKKAFRIERPYLYVTKVEGNDLTPEPALEKSRPTMSFATVTIKNAGKGPAVNLQIKGRLTISLDPKVPLPLPLNLTIGQAVERIEERVIGSDSRSRFMVFWEGSFEDPEHHARISEHTYSALMRQLGNLILYGTIDYEDVLGNSYKTTFGYIWVPGIVNMGRPGNFYRGSSEYNRTT